jgi:hypothetical protein
MKIKYLILTRLAMESKKFEITNEWLDKRIKLYKDICYPSILNQTNQNFKWLIWNTKDELSENYINELKELDTENIFHFFEERGKDYVELTKEWIYEKLNLDTDVLITSRIDTDDAFSNDYVDTVYKCIDLTKRPFVLNFSSGFEYNTKTKRYTIRTKRDTNMFTTVISNYDRLYHTVLDEPHTKLSRKFKQVYQWNEKPMWLQLMHDSNIYTQDNMGKKIRFPKFYNSIKERFPNINIPI